MDGDGRKRYDFQFINKRGYKTTIEGLSEKFNPEFWNYAKLISGVLRYGMPIDQVLKLVGGLELIRLISTHGRMVLKGLLRSTFPTEWQPQVRSVRNVGQRL